MSMKIGELDYTDDFDYSKTVEKGGKNISLQIMFLIFIVSITLIVMNLMLAVTVSKCRNSPPCCQCYKCLHYLGTVSGTDSKTLSIQ